MAEKVDTSPEEEAVKDDAREFMSGLVGRGTTSASDAPTAAGAEIVKAWKSRYASNKNDNKNTAIDEFWCLYDGDLTSIWTMVYDEADSNEDLDETIKGVADLLHQPGMAKLRDDCFGIVHTLESLEIMGLWFFNGPDPSELFGANPETSWYTFAQLGPEATELVKAAAGKMLMPVDGKLDGKVIKDTKVFC